MASRHIWADAALYLASMLVALATARWDSIPLLRSSASAATVPYLAGTVAAAGLALGWSRIAPRSRLRLRISLAAIVFAGALALPLARAVTRRIPDGRATHAQSEVLITEEAAAALVRGADPYATDYDRGPLAGWPEGTRHHLPYLPGELLFGLPYALGMDGALADPRVWFLGVAMATIGAALVIARARPDRALTVVLVALAIPTGARVAVGGGDDLPVIGLMLLALAMLERRRPVAAGLTLGMAAVVKQTAWPLVPFLVLAARDRRGSPAGRRALAAAAAPVVLAVTPFLLWHPAAFLEDVVLFPLGLAGEPTQAASPTIGHLLAGILPGGLALVPLVAALGCAALAIGRRPRLTPRQAATGASLLLIAAVLLSTAGRFGYLIYPLNLLVFSRLLLRGSTDTQPEPISNAVAPAPAPVSPALQAAL